jgi:plasmid stability protein
MSEPMNAKERDQAMDDEELIITDLSDDMIAALQLRADAHGCTLEEEVCRILEEELSKSEK